MMAVASIKKLLMELPSERANASFRKINVSNNCKMCDSLATWFSNVIKTTNVALLIY